MRRLLRRIMAPPSPDMPNSRGAMGAVCCCWYECTANMSYAHECSTITSLQIWVSPNKPPNITDMDQPVTTLLIAIY
jgi:hypothetical protein